MIPISSSILTGMLQRLGLLSRLEGHVHGLNSMFIQFHDFKVQSHAESDGSGWAPATLVDV